MTIRNIHHAAAAVVTVIALSLLFAPASADALNADGVSARIIGKDLVARRMGMKVHLHYDPDGSVTIRSLLFSGTGRWRRNGNRLRMAVAGAPGPETSCHGFEDPGSDKFRNSDGMVLQEEEWIRHNRRHRPIGATKVKPVIRNWIFGMIVAIFGIITLIEGGSVLFSHGPARAAAGNFVPAVLWVNFLFGFIYILAGVAILRGRRSRPILARALAGILLILFDYLLVHILMGGAWERRTLGAMTLRLGFWVAAALLVRPGSASGKPVG